MVKSLLILGAGGHGKVVKEVAQAMVDHNGAAVYGSIDFLDDAAPEAIGKITELERIVKAGGKVPVLIHPTAYVSLSAVIKAGTVVEPMVVVNANTVVEKGCLISVTALVDHDVVLEKCSHVNAGALCKAGSGIESGFVGRRH